MKGIRICLGLLALLAQAGALPAAPNELVVTPRQIQALAIDTAPVLAVIEEGANGLPARVAIPTAQTRVVSAPLAGLVQSTAVAVGDAVRSGQALVLLQSPGLVEAQRAYLHALVESGLAQAALARDEELFREGIIAESRQLATRGRAASAAASLAETRQMLQLLGMGEASIARLARSGELGNTLTLVSPLDGVILELMVVSGQRAEAAAPLVKLARLKPLWLEIQVPAARVGTLVAGAPVAVPAAQASGTVVSIGRHVDPANQTVQVRAEISQGAERLWPGQMVEAIIAWEPASVHWHIPPAAIVREEGRAYVFVQTQKGFRAEPVRILGETRDAVTVAGALGADERIAVKGLAALKGMRSGLGAE